MEEREVRPRSPTHRVRETALRLSAEAGFSPAACLLLLTEEQKGDYNALVGALQRRFGQYNQPVLLRSEFHNRRRLPGEPLRILAHEVECLCRRAYDSMPPSVQAELARDQFLQALSPKELRMQTQLARPATLSAALELVLEREMLAGSSGGADDTHVDACILGLDFLRAIGGVLDLGKGFLILPDGKKVQLIPPPVCPASAAASTSTSETPADPPAEQQAGEEERLSAVRSIWSKNLHGSSFDAALDALRQVLGRVAAAGLKLHPDKCHFMRREVEFLGHKLGQEGISTLEEKIHTITEWPTPADQKQLKTFLGLASYYRRFVKGFSSIAAPLFRLLQKDRDFIWTQDCQQAFNTLRRSLTESPVLAPPDPTLPFVLDTDASNVGLGAVLSQVGPDGEKVVAYFSRVLNRTGCRYCEKREETERELTTMDGATQLTCRALLVVDAAEWRAQQEQDTDLLPVLQWLEREERPLWDEVTGFSICTMGLWAKFTALRLKEGVLERAWKDPATGEERWQVVVPRSLRSAVLEACHGSTGSGHFGVSKTLRRLRQGYYWGQQRRDVEDFCRSCDACSSHKGPQDQSRAQLQQQPAGAPMERVAVDVMGPFPRTDRGNRYVLVAMDYFTKWPEAYAIPDQEAETVADVLVEGMFSRFGTAETLHSDQGRNFESKVFAAMCKRLGIKKTRTTPLHPQSNGLVERFNRTLAQQLAMLTSEHQQDWDYHLPLILMAYRSAVQDSTQCTPALLMLGTELRTPAELAFGKPPDAPEAPPGRDYARKLQDRLDSAHSYAREQLAKAGLRQKRNYDISTKGRHFCAGELVWIYSPKRKKGRCPKLDSSWVGPCSVLERVGEVVYRVQLPPRGRKVALHRDQMAPYRGQSLPSFPEGRVQSPHDPAQRDPRPELRSPPSGSPPQSLKALCTPQGLRRSRRERRLPPRLRDCVVPSGTRNLLLGGQCNDG
ncbi:unnamed protein product [Oreochromis niloticus]|nr:unnamed protein product [Mustela putorius furo]